MTTATHNVNNPFALDVIKLRQNSIEAITDQKSATQLSAEMRGFE